MKHGRIVAGAWTWGPSASLRTRWIARNLPYYTSENFRMSRHALTVPLEVAHHLAELLLRYLSLGVPLSEYLRCSVVSPPPIPSPVAPPPAPRSEEPADCPEEEEEREDPTDPWKAKREEGGIECCRGSRGPIGIETRKEGEEPNDYHCHPDPHPEQPLVAATFPGPHHEASRRARSIFFTLFAASPSRLSPSRGTSLSSPSSSRPSPPSSIRSPPRVHRTA